MEWSLAWSEHLVQETELETKQTKKNAEFSTNININTLGALHRDMPVTDQT